MSKFNVLNSLKRNLATHEEGAENQNKAGEGKCNRDDLETYRDINNEKYMDDNARELAHLRDSMTNTTKHENMDITMINVEEAHFYPDTHTQSPIEGAIYRRNGTIIAVSGPNAPEGIEKVLEAESQKDDEEFIRDTIKDVVRQGKKVMKKRKRKKPSL